MIRIIRASSLRALQAQGEVLDGVRGALRTAEQKAEVEVRRADSAEERCRRLWSRLEQAREEATAAIETASGAETTVGDLRGELAQAEAELVTLRAVRRKEAAVCDCIYLLYRRGTVRSAHLSSEEARAAAEAAGADCRGWTTGGPSVPTSAAEWQVQSVPLGGAG